MIKRFFTKFVAAFESQSPTTKGFIILGIALLIGIILRWRFILSEVIRGFDFFNK